MTERLRDIRPSGRAGLCRASAMVLLCFGQLLVGPARAGLVMTPATEGSLVAIEQLMVVERLAAHEALVARHERLLRERAAVTATERAAELRLRRLLVELTELAEAQAAAAALVRQREAELAVRQRRLELLLAEIVQLSRDEQADARRLAQLRAVAATLTGPFTRAKEAVRDSLATVEALEQQAAERHRLSVEARQSLVDAGARQGWLSAALDETAALATESSGRAFAAERMAVRTAMRMAHGSVARQMAALPSPQNEPRAGARAPSRLAPVGLSLRAASAERPFRPVAQVGPPLAQSLSRGQAVAQLMPVSGEVVGHFGDAQNTPFDRGLTIEVDERRLVRAPRDGRVVFARGYDGFGLLLIIDHGGEYHSLLSGFSRFVVHEGWTVRAGQMVGIIEPGSAAAGRLYVELRRRGVPVDPFAWFAAGQDKVRS